MSVRIHIEGDFSITELPNKNFKIIEINTNKTKISNIEDDTNGTIETMFESNIHCSSCGDNISEEDDAYCDYCYDKEKDEVDKGNDDLQTEIDRLAKDNDNLCGILDELKQTVLRLRELLSNNSCNGNCTCNN